MAAAIAATPAYPKALTWSAAPDEAAVEAPDDVAEVPAEEVRVDDPVADEAAADPEEAAADPEEAAADEAELAAAEPDEAAAEAVEEAEEPDSPNKEAPFDPTMPPETSLPATDRPAFAAAEL